MKKTFGAALAAGLMILVGFTGAARPMNASAEEEIASGFKATYTCDAASGTLVYAKNETERLPIASMCKIMTLLLCFEEADSGKLQYDEQISVSENAAGMGGSQVFLGSGLTYTAGELIKSIAVCSANDSCVALAERIAGSESAFVDKMNARARELGADNTLFANCTGLPKETQYSCAKDVSVMLRALISHSKYFEYSRVWLEDFAHPDGRTTCITNTNKLVRFYEGCDGGKTGFTNEAGFCLAATAKRGETRLISVVIGSESAKVRNAAVSKLLDYGFANYSTRTLLAAGQPFEEKRPVKGSATHDIAVAAETPLVAFTKKGAEGECEIEYHFLEELKAPIAVGEQVGEAVLYMNGVKVASVRLVAVDNAERYSWWDAYRESARNWN